MSKTTTQTLISADRNLHLGECVLTHDMFTPKCPTPWSVRMQQLKGGKQQGVDLITIDNGQITIRICPTRGMGIIDVTSGDVRLGWNSPVKEIVHPAFINQLNRGRTAWLEGFNEFLVRCGLEFMGPPCDEDHHLAVGEPPPIQTSLHGKIANIPASEVELEVQTTAPYAITLRGIVHERSMYGPKYELAAELTVVPGENTFTVNDNITNRGGQPVELCLLYHINQGRPILEEGAQLVAPVKKCEPRDEGYPAKDVKHYDRYHPPMPGSPEQCYFIDMNPDPKGNVGLVLHNKNKDMGLGVSWNKKQLPNFALWKALHHEADGYVTGIEPCVTLPMPRPHEREAGRVKVLKPGKSHKAELTFEVLKDSSAVKRAASQV